MAFTENEYCELFSMPLDLWQQQCFGFTQQHPEKHLMSSALQGVFLKQLIQWQRPGRVLEMGTFTGFTALCMASALEPGALLTTLELREVDANTARNFFAAAPYGNKIELLVGDAHAQLKSLVGPWDFVFIDAEKTGYIEYYEYAVAHLSNRGVIVVDNVLFHGEVLKDTIEGKNAKAIQRFNEHVKKDIRTQQVLLPVRDGLSLICLAG